MLLSRRRTGACGALRWNAEQSVYRCGAVEQPAALLRATLPGCLQRLVPVLELVLRRFARRWIAAGTACDSSLEPVPVQGADLAPPAGTSA